MWIAGMHENIAVSVLPWVDLAVLLCTEVWIWIPKVKEIAKGDIFSLLNSCFYFPFTTSVPSLKSLKTLNSFLRVFSPPIHCFLIWKKASALWEVCLLYFTIGETVTIWTEPLQRYVDRSSKGRLQEATVISFSCAVHVKWALWAHQLVSAALKLRVWTSLPRASPVLVHLQIRQEGEWGPEWQWSLSPGLYTCTDKPCTTQLNVRRM